MYCRIVQKIFIFLFFLSLKLYILLWFNKLFHCSCGSVRQVPVSGMFCRQVILTIKVALNHFFFFFLQLPIKAGQQNTHTKVSMEHNKECLINISKYKFSLVISGLTHILKNVNNMVSFQSMVPKNIVFVVDVLLRRLAVPILQIEILPAVPPAGGKKNYYCPHNLFDQPI